MTGRLSHEEALELLPWLVNDTLDDAERKPLERHLRECLHCHGELRAQRALRGIVRRQPTVQCSPEQGFEQLSRRMDAPLCDAAAGGGWHTARSLWPAGRLPLRLAAGAATLLLAAGAVTIWLSSGGSGGQAPYAALTGQTESAAGGRLDIIFAPGVSETGMRALLTEIDATIVAGPSRLGRYTVRLESAGAMSDDARRALIERLRADERVRFAGPTFIGEDSAP